MRWPWLDALTALALATATGLAEEPARPAAVATAWGEAVDGVRCRLTLNTGRTVPWQSVDATIDLRNDSKEPIAVDRGDVRIDVKGSARVVRFPMPPGPLPPEPVYVIEPGKEVAIESAALRVGFTGWELEPGTCEVRVSIFFSVGRPPDRTPGDPVVRAKLTEVRTSGAKLVVDPDPDAYAKIVAAMSRLNSYAPERAKAVDEVRALGADGQRVLAEMIGHRRYREDWQVIILVGEASVADAVPRLVELSRTPQGNVALGALTRIKDARAGRALVDWLERFLERDFSEVHPGGDIGAIMLNLVETGEADALPVIRRCLAHPSVGNWSYSAPDAMAAVAGRHWSPAVEQQAVKDLKDASWPIRLAAVKTLQHAKASSELVEALRPCLTDSFPYVTTAAAGVMAKWRTRESINALVAVLKTRPPSHDQGDAHDSRMIEAVLSLGDPAMEDLVMSEYAEASRWYQYRAVELLTRNPSPKVIAWLTRLAADPVSSDGRGTARSALERLRR